MSKSKKYKRDYLDAIKNVIPTFYFVEDFNVSGTQRTATDGLVNSHINFCINQSTLLNISATDNFSNIVDVSGMMPWFVVKNKLTDITPRDFELDIMHPLGHCVGEYTGQKCAFFNQDNNITDFSADQKETFRLFLENTLLPKITLNSNNLATTTASAFDNTASGTHEHLINTLGWAYFLNTSGDLYSPSSYVASAISDIYFDNSKFTTTVGVKGASEYVWRNWASLSATHPSLLNSAYVSGSGEYTSGIQNLKGLQTLIDIVYSDKLSNEEDTYVQDAFQNYISMGDLLVGEELAAPFSRFLQSLSYSFFDTNDDVSKLATLYDIERCPDNALPYLADLIGWRLFGSSPTSWRRQIRAAASLYKQKGTKEGLYNAITTVLPTISLQPEDISEFYESYIPFLIYYLLKTDTDLFNSWTSFDSAKAQKYIPNDYDPINMDNNIRKVVDWMLVKAVILFPDLFWVKNFKFNLDDPQFKFYYRDRAFPIPPWEEEKFYTNCDITDELAAFFERELICLGVAETNANAFRSYISNNTYKGSADTRFYDNGFFFLTSSISQPPNANTILANYEVEKYDYFPLWNSKSSHFDIDVSTGSFDATFFQGKDFLKQDFFQSLAIVDSFSPSKAIPRTRVSLTTTDTLSSLDYTCPSLRMWTLDMPLSGAAAAYRDSGVDFRGIPGVFGSDYPVPPNSSRAKVDHSNKPVYTRSYIDSPLDKINLMGSSIDQVPLTTVDRNNMRRRNFETSLQKGGLYTRTGYNMPSYFNTSNEGTDVEYQALGLLNLIFQYHDVVNPYDLYEVSSFPANLDIWSKCWDLYSSNDMSGIAASSTFDIRGSTPIEMSTCNDYVARERTPDFFKYLYKILGNKLQHQANFLMDTNGFVLGASSFMDLSTSLYNDLWKSYDLSEEELYDIILGQRVFSRGSKSGIHKTYKDFIKYYADRGTGNSLLATKEEGGRNIISHAYGPLLYNANFTIAGSGVDSSVSSQLISKTTLEEYPFSVKDLTGLNNIEVTSTSSLYVDTPELRNPYVFSGVEFTDTSSGKSTFTIFNLDASTAVRGAVNYLVNNPIVLCKPKGGLPRLRYAVDDYGPFGNVLIPEHDFEFELRATVGTEDSTTLGKGSYGVWIHTEVEKDHHGNSVFWTYMPNGKWQIMTPDTITSPTGSQHIKATLAHKLDYGESYSPSSDNLPCYLTESTKDVLIDMSKDDFQSKTFRFNTNNIPIKVPLSYYQRYQQVHRDDQKYVIEVFMYDNPDTKKFGMIDYVSAKDVTQYKRLHHKHTFTYEDYRHTKDLISEDYQFIDQSGGVMSPGSVLTIDASGNIFTSDEGKVTYKESIYEGIGTKAVRLFSTVDASEKIKWKYDANQTPILFDNTKYSGNITLVDASTITPAEVVIQGKDLGSNITKQKTLNIPYVEDEALGVLREFNRLQKDLGARNSNISSPRYALSGGSRASYNVAPMHSNLGGHQSFVDDYNQYTDLYLSDKPFYGSRVLKFRKSDPQKFDGWTFPGAGLPRYRMLHYYTDFRNADSNNYEYYNIYLDINVPALPDSNAVISITGPGTHDDWLISRPWDIVSGVSHDPVPMTGSPGSYFLDIDIPEGITSTYFTVRMKSTAGESHWNEYSLFFKLRPSLSNNIIKGPFSDFPTNEFRLHVKEEKLPYTSGAGGAFSGCSIPPVLWFSTSSISTAAQVNKIVPIRTDIHGASGPGLPLLNESSYWYWASAGGDLVSGTDWIMCDSLGNEVAPGQHVLSSIHENVYIKLLTTNTGSIDISGHYEQVDLSSQGASSFSLVSAVNENLWPNTSAMDKMRIRYGDIRWPGRGYPGSDGGAWVSNEEMPPSRTSNGDPAPIRMLRDPVKVDAMGNPLPVLYLTSGYMDPGINTIGANGIPYMRIDLDGEYGTDAATDYFNNKGYTVLAFKFQDPSFSINGNINDLPDSRYGSYQGSPAYTQISLRDKSSNVQVSAGCDETPPRCITHLAGDTDFRARFKRNFSLSSWEFHNTVAANYQQIGVDPAGSGGVVSGTDVYGNAEYICWVVRSDIGSPERLAYGGINGLPRPLFGMKNGTTQSKIASDDWAVLSGAICMYDPWLQTYDSSAVGTPVHTLLTQNKLPEFWRNEGDYWSPRGTLTVPKQGDPNFSNKFTLTVT